MAGSNLVPFQVVLFDVGGTLFSTTIETLHTFPDSLLPSMCRESLVSVGEKAIYIDRCPEGFKWILSLYRLDVLSF